MQQQNNPFTDLRAEKVLLHQIAISNSFQDVYDMDLLPSDFAFKAHQEIYEVFLTVANEVNDEQFTDITLRLNDQVREYYVNELINNYVVGDKEEAYEIIKELSRKRKIGRKFQELSSKLTKENSLDILDKLTEFCTEIADEATNSEVLDMPHIMQTVNFEIEESILNKPINGVTSNIEAIDDIVGVMGNSQLVTIGAPSSHGKTSMALSFVYNQIKKGVKVGFISLEMSATELGLRLASIQSGFTYGFDKAVSSDKISKRLAVDEEYQRIQNSVYELMDKQLFIVDKDSIHINEIGRIARRLKQANDIDVLYIDYLQLIKTDRGHSRENEVSEISRSLKGFAKKLDIPIVTLSQLNRDVNKRKSVPVPSDLRESAAIEHDSDKLILFWQPMKIMENDNGNNSKYLPNTVEVNVCKNRQGKTSVFKLTFDTETTFMRKYSEYPTNEPYKGKASSLDDMPF